jgi:hypothetical protein
VSKGKKELTNAIKHFADTEGFILIRNLTRENVMSPRKAAPAVTATDDEQNKWPTIDRMYQVIEFLLNMKLARSSDISVVKGTLQSAVRAVILDDHVEELNEELKNAGTFSHAMGRAVYARRQHSKPISESDKLKFQGMALKRVPAPDPPELDKPEGEDNMASTQTSSTRSKKGTPKAVVAKGAKKGKAATTNGTGKARGKPSEFAGCILIATEKENPRHNPSCGYDSYALLLKAGPKGELYENLAAEGGRSKDYKYDKDKGRIKVIKPKGAKAANARASSSSVKRSKRR